MSVKRLGFCCKWIDNASQVNGISPKDDCKKYNTGSTTSAWLRRQTTAQAEDKLRELMHQNIRSIYNLVERVGQLPESLRMVRLSSDILPMYTEANFSYFWQLSDIQSELETMFMSVGNLARKNNVRLSFHPGQFTVLASDNDDIVNRSISEFEYHADMARMMGYGKKFQDFKINVHIAGRRGPDGIRAAYKQLSTEARNCITIENEENSWGLDDCLKLADILPIVMDIHHNWCKEGEYIEPTSDRVKRVIDSWQGVRPAMHYSVSRETVLPEHCNDTMPDYNSLISAGIGKQKLRAHSDFYWNRALNQWAGGFMDQFDIQCESKGKNLSTFALAKELGITAI